MEKQIKNEIKSLMKAGIPEDLAILSAGLKYGNNDIVNSILDEKHDEQEELRQALQFFKPFAPMALQDDQEKIIVQENPIPVEAETVMCPSPFVVEEEEDTIKVIYDNLVENGIIEACDSKQK